MAGTRIGGSTAANTNGLHIGNNPAATPLVATSVDDCYVEGIVECTSLTVIDTLSADIISANISIGTIGNIECLGTVFGGTLSGPVINGDSQSGYYWHNPVLAQQNAPPVSPTTGNRYLVGTSGSGLWTGLNNQIVYFDGSNWNEQSKVVGSAVYVVGSTQYLYWTGSAWTNLISADNELNALAGTTAAANAVPYFDSTTTASTFPTNAGTRALMNVTPAGDKVPYFTSNVGATVFTMTAGARAAASLEGAADQIVYTTSDSAASVATLTSTARSILDDTSTAAVCTTIGLGTASNVTHNNLSLNATTNQIVLDADGSFTGTLTMATLSGSSKTWTLPNTTGTLLVSADIGSTVQAYDAELAALASTTSSSNAVPYYTGSGTASTFSSTAAGRSLVGITPSTDYMIYATSSSSFSTFPSTAGGRALCATSGSTDAAPYFTSSSAVSTYSTTTGGRALVGTTGSTNAVPYWTSSSATSTFTSTTGGRALVGVTGATDNIPYFTSSSAVSTFATTAAGRALIGLTGAADTLFYTTSSSAATTTTLTSFARTLLDDTTAAAARTTLGVNRKSVCIAAVAPTTDTSTGDGKAYFVVPSIMNGLNIVAVHAAVITAGTTNTTDIQIARIRSGSPVDVLSTKLTIDSTETGSDTAATAAVINTTNDDLATYDLLRIDIDAISTTAAKGLLITIEAEI